MGMWKWGGKRNLLLLVVLSGTFFLFMRMEKPTISCFDCPELENSQRTNLLVNRPKIFPGTLYRNRNSFELGYKQMLKKFRIYVYPDAFTESNPYSNVFIAHRNPYDRKLGNYFSEHIFKINLLNSSFITTNPTEASLFYLPFSVNVMRNDPRIHSEALISKFVAHYVSNVSSQYDFWNLSQGADHFYLCCHSVCREAAAGSVGIQKNAIQVTCSSNYYNKFFISHKDVALPQVWPRSPASFINPPEKRTRLAFFSGRIQNSRVRDKLVKFWSKDTDMDIYAGAVNGSYEDAFSRSKFCLHVKGYEVNTARISDAIHFGCVPVIISNYYDLPFSDILDWNRFSVIVSHDDISSLKDILLRISDDEYSHLHTNVLEVQKHFGWHQIPQQYDSFHMIMYELWLKSRLVRHHSVAIK